MLYDISLSGIALCYAPLVITILAFVGFAAMTDAEARRTYLRRLDLRTEDEMPEVLEPIVTERKTVETPSGARVTLIPPGEDA